MTALLHRLTGSQAPLLLTLGLALLLAACAARADSPQIDLPRIALTAGIHRIDAQVAATPAQRQIGLMWRKEMPQNEGMLFIFEQPSVQCFWMMNTLLPLTAVLASEPSSVVSVALRLPTAVRLRVNDPLPLIGAPPRMTGELVAGRTNTVEGKAKTGKGAARASRAKLTCARALLPCCTVRVSDCPAPPLTLRLPEAR